MTSHPRRDNIGEPVEWPVRVRLFEDVQDYANQALAKHGPPTSNLQRAVNILTEELGEVAQCVNKITSGNLDERNRDKDGLRLGPATGTPYWRAELRTELCQLAAYALLQIQRLDDEGQGKENTSCQIQS